MPAVTTSVATASTSDPGSRSDPIVHVLQTLGRPLIGYGLPRSSTGPCRGTSALRHVDPVPSEGGMLSRERRQHMEMAPRLAIWPGLCLTIVVYRINMFGDALCDLLHPRLRGTLGNSFLGDRRVEEWILGSLPATLEPGRHADLIDGEIAMHSPVSLRHAQLLNFVNHLVRSFVEERALGQLFREVVAVRLNSRNAFLPDLAFYRSQRLDLLRATMIDGAPDLAVEVLSPRTADRDEGVSSAARQPLTCCGRRKARAGLAAAVSLPVPAIPWPTRWRQTPPASHPWPGAYPTRAGSSAPTREWPWCTWRARSPACPASASRRPPRHRDTAR